MNPMVSGLKMGLSAILAASIAAFVVGCAPMPAGPPSPETIAKMQEARRLAAQDAVRVYRSISKAEIMSAVVKIFDHLDKNDYRFQVEDDRVLISRDSFMLGFLISQSTRDFWEFKITPEEPNSYKVAIGLAHVGVISTFPSTIAERFRREILEPPRPIDSRLIHDRLEFFIGIRADWPDCKDYKFVNGVSMNPYCDFELMDDRKPSTR